MYIPFAHSEQQTKMFVGLSVFLSLITIGSMHYANLSGSTVSIEVFSIFNPFITNVSSPSSDGTYRPGNTVLIHVQVSKKVYVDETGGTPTISLNSGGTGVYTSGSGSKTLVFTYVVQTGDSSSDLDADSANALALNGGTIKDAGDLDTNLTLPTPGEEGSLSANDNIVVAASANSNESGDSSENITRGITAGTGGGDNSPSDSGGSEEEEVEEELHPAALDLASIYTDIPDDAWYRPAVQYLLSIGVLDNTQTKFRPNDESNRAEIATLMMRILQKEGDPQSRNSFVDIEDNTWFTEGVYWCADNGLMRGDSNCFGKDNCSFYPDRSITRAEFAAVIVRGFSKEIGTYVKSFSDVPELTWYHPPVQIAASHCIIRGDEGATTMRPHAPINRAELAVMLHRALEESEQVCAY